MVILWDRPAANKSDLNVRIKVYLIKVIDQDTFVRGNENHLLIPSN